MCYHWTLEIEFNESLSLSIIRLANYNVTTSLIYKTDSLGDAQGFSGKTPITPSGSFSIEILTGVTLSWRTELDRSIHTMEDRIPGRLQHRHEMCCKKGGHYGRWAYMIWRWLHCGDIFPDEWTCIWHCLRVLRNDSLWGQIPGMLFANF